MATYTYLAHTTIGIAESGKMEGADHEEIIHRLRAQGKYCYEIKELHENSAEYRPLKLKELTVFCRQLAAMISAGINMSRALDTLYQSNGSKRMRAATLDLHERVLKGQSLSKSMQEMGKSFPDLLVYMMATGEESGTLDQIMEEMADYFEKEYQLKKKVQSALIYPSILSVISIGMVIFMLIKVLPQFVSMYAGVALPLPTRMLLALSDFVVNKWVLILGGLLAIALFFAWLMTKKEVRIKIKQLQLKMPIVGKLIRTILTARFAETFSVLISSGISILQSTEIASKVMANEYVEQKLVSVSEELQKGNMFSGALEKINVFDTMLITMISVGEESGNLDNMLKRTGVHFQREAETALGRLVALIEPVMIVVLGFVVGFIVLAIITPVFSMYSQIL